MSWLVSDARVLASARVTEGLKDRRRGLLGTESTDGALIIDPCRSVHTVGMRYAIDVAFVDADGVVIKTLHMRRHRLVLPVMRARWVIEAEAGAFARWGLRVGDVVELRAGETSPS